MSQETLNQMPRLAAKFARDLLVVDVTRRLGCTRGIEELKAHPSPGPSPSPNPSHRGAQGTPAARVGLESLTVELKAHLLLEG